MRILPVLDLMNGLVVRGVAGRRQEYRPILSPLTPSVFPLTIAQAFRDHFGLDELYLADLDAIAGQPPAMAIYAALHAAGFRLWVDAGLKTVHDAQLLVDSGIDTLIAGLETLAGPEELAALIRFFSPRRIVFSLDLRAGQPLGPRERWDAGDAWSIARRAVSCGLERLLILDLARVGVGTGSGTEDLCRRLHHAYPRLKVAAGGGIRDRADLQQMCDCGVSIVLVASALHDGRLLRADLEAVRDFS